MILGKRKLEETSTSEEDNFYKDIPSGIENISIQNILDYLSSKTITLTTLRIFIKIIYENEITDLWYCSSIHSLLRNREDMITTIKNCITSICVSKNWINETSTRNEIIKKLIKEITLFFLPINSLFNINETSIQYLSHCLGCFNKTQCIYNDNNKSCSENREIIEHILQCKKDNCNEKCCSLITKLKLETHFKNCQDKNKCNLCLKKLFYNEQNTHLDFRHCLCNNSVFSLGPPQGTIKISSTSKILKCSICKTYLHEDCLPSIKEKTLSSSSSPTTFQCFHCRSKTIDDFQIILKNYVQLSLIKKTKYTLNFLISDETLLKQLKDPNSNLDFRLCSLVSSTNDKIHQFPFGCKVFINNHQIPIITKPISGPYYSREKKKCELIGKYLVYGVNTLYIQNFFDINCPLVLLIQAVKNVSTIELINKIKEKRILPLSTIKDEDLADLSVPGKGSTCEHTKCFDLLSYINQWRDCDKNNEESWCCPICKKKTLIKDLYYVTKVVQNPLNT